MKCVRLVWLPIALFASTGCGNAPAALDVRFLAAEDACLAQLVYQAATSDTTSYAPFALARWRFYAAIDSSLNHARSSEDSARFIHRSALYQRAASARDRHERADLGSDYAERLAEIAAGSGAQCRTHAAGKSE